ncbi:PTS transporter subunit EIIC [Paenibacillus barcinonensis]|uniref:PTS system beta-glucosides-specific IIC component n=1 Tax=Paenibacillus barcinonensis TaxID=198119 RepID=A0A2V4WPG6_PAEBA|nr:PTS transporter subunit EIIC [Paenibacillus barcinonensis]PYE49742.1 PTS system beta-glucosides-specific IIC component [Paenibacillus barcinonensis]QKS56563.1 PTS transporter subunit EIIC [Paenibacillus barcinonensis]
MEDNKEVKKQEQQKVEQEQRMEERKAAKELDQEKELQEVQAVQEGSQNKVMKANRLSRLLHFIADVFSPLMPVLLGAAVLKCILGLIAFIYSFGEPDSSSFINGQTWMIWKSIGDSAFYLLPVLVAISTAHRLRSNLYVAGAIGGLMLYPQMIQLMAGGEEVHFMKVPLVSQAPFYSASLWVIAAIAIVSWAERHVERLSPEWLKGILAPALALGLMVPVVLMVLGPLGTWSGEQFSEGINSLLSDAPTVLLILLGALMPLLMLTGMHYWLIPILIHELMTTGSTILVPVMMVAFVAQAGAALAAGLRSQQAQSRKLSFWASAAALFGVTEPAMYAVNMRSWATFGGAMLGGAFGALYFGLLSVRSLVIGGTGSLLELPFYIEEGTLNMLHTCIGVGIAYVISAVFAYMMMRRKMQ